jgi:hypothetical protein
MQQQMGLMPLRKQESTKLRHQFHDRETLMTRCLPRETDSVYSPQAGNKLWKVTYRSVGAIVIEPARLVSLGSMSNILYLDSD